MKPHFQVFAAGACLNDGEPGGWAFRIVHPKSGANIGRSGAVTFGTTVMRMQMLAIVLGLERIRQKSKVQLFSSIGEELAEQLPYWKNDRYKIANEDLWACLDKLCGKNGHAVTIGKADLGCVTEVAEKIAITLSWQRGLPVLPRTEWPNEKPPQEEFFKKFEEMKRRRELQDKQLFIVQSADGDFVLRVDDDGHSTVCGPHFVFTKDRDKARVFRYDELWRTSDLASQFAEGFPGSRSRRITVTL